MTEYYKKCRNDFLDCADKNVYCGIWALKRLCATGSHQLWMADNCKKSCGIC